MLRLSPRALVVAGASAAAALLLAGAAAGDATRGRWLRPTIALAPGGASDTQLRVASGLAVAVWSAPGGVQARIARLGSWGPVADLGYLQRPRLAIDRAGDAIVTGIQPDQSSSRTWRLVSLVRPVGSGQWGEPVPVSASERDITETALAANDAGEAVAAWTSPDGGLAVARAALRRPDGTWGRPENLGYAGSYHGPYAAIDARGDAVVVWTRDSSDSTASVYAEAHPAGGSWGPAVLLSTHAVAGNAGIAMNRAGDALAVWGEADESGRVALVSSLRRAGASAWDPLSRIPVSDPVVGLYRYYGLSFALDDAGNATLGEQRADGTVEAATRTAGADRWNGPVVLGNGGGGGAWYTYDTWCVSPQVAVDAAGAAVVVWGGDALYSVRREPGQAWEAPVTVAPGPVCFARSLAADAAGDAVAIWNGSSAAVTRLDGAVLDATPPTIGRVAVPRSARAGRPARLSVSASDLWSSLAPPLWRLGDGSRQRGVVVRHVYRRPGRYRVTVTVTDEGGNSTSATATVRVAAQR